MLAADQHRDDWINILHLTPERRPRACLQEELGTFASVYCRNRRPSAQFHGRVEPLLDVSEGLAVAHQLKGGSFSRVCGRVLRKNTGRCPRSEKVARNSLESRNQEKKTQSLKITALICVAATARWYTYCCRDCMFLSQPLHNTVLGTLHFLFLFFFLLLSATGSEPPLMLSQMDRTDLSRWPVQRGDGWETNSLASFRMN